MSYIVRIGIHQTQIASGDSPQKVCHPERVEKIEDFCKESKDLRTGLSMLVP